MVSFNERAFKKSDHFFVHEDPARIYRGLKDMMVSEFDMDRIVEGKMEFSVKKPKDRIRLHAFKEKSMHTVIHYYLSLKAKAPRDIYKYDRDDDILKARFQVDASVKTVYPGAEPLSIEPQPYKGTDSEGRVWHSGLEAEHKKPYHHSKLYEILVGIWYNKFYSREIETYEEEAAETGLRMMNIMRERFGAEDAIVRTGSSEYEPPWQGQ
ncbi:MAG: hypothetical protein ABEJ03_02780 [Candidatus Nanohaloarchaea archaeon]